MEYPVHVTFLCEAAIERRVRVEAAKRDMNRSQFIIAAIVEKLGRIEDEQGNADSLQQATE